VAEAGEHVGALDPGRRRVALLQLDHPGGQVLGLLGVEVVGHRRVEHLLASRHALAEVLSRAHLFHEIGRDRLAGRVARKALED